jgi:hypothetical protein
MVYFETVKIVELIIVSLHLRDDGPEKRTPSLSPPAILGATAVNRLANQIIQMHVQRQRGKSYCISLALSLAFCLLTYISPLYILTKREPCLVSSPLDRPWSADYTKKTLS